MTTTRACLVDVYGTLLADNAEAGGRELAELAGADAQAWRAEYARLLPDRCTGRLSSAEAAERVMRACGIDPAAELISAVVSAHRELMIEGCPPYDDAVPFLEQLRQCGIKIALVSNCADNTRSFLADVNLLQLADEVILSCEAGFAACRSNLIAAAGENMAKVTLSERHRCQCTPRTLHRSPATRIKHAFKRPVATALHPTGLSCTSLHGLQPAGIFYPDFYPARSARLTTGGRVPAQRGIHVNQRIARGGSFQAGHAVSITVARSSSSAAHFELSWGTRLRSRARWESP